MAATGTVSISLHTKKTKASQKFVILRRTINDKIANIVLLFLTLP